MLAPSHRYARIDPRKSAGRSAASISVRKVRFGSALDSTRRAWISSPSARTTPVARPPRIAIRATVVPVRIAAPASRAASAIRAVTTPIPPGTKPQPRPPPEPPDAASCSRLYAVPGVDGPARVLLIDSQPSADFTMSFSKCSSRKRFADVANRNAASSRSRRDRNPSRPNLREGAQVVDRSGPRVRRGPVEHRHQRPRDPGELLLVVGEAGCVDAGRACESPRSSSSDRRAG